MSERTPVQLLDRSTGLLVDATLIDGMSAAEVAAAEAVWKPFLDAQLKRLQITRDKWPQHRHWDWTGKSQDAEKCIAYRMFGIECQGEIQGMMLLITAGYNSRIVKITPLTYVHLLAAAPWNVPSIMGKGKTRYSLVGSVLVATAIHVSLEDELNGRIGLHSLPQSDDFYRTKCGMTDLGEDPVLHMHYFEMTPEQASDFLK